MGAALHPCNAVGSHVDWHIVAVLLLVVAGAEPAPGHAREAGRWAQTIAWQLRIAIGRALLVLLLSCPDVYQQGCCLIHNCFCQHLRC